MTLDPNLESNSSQIAPAKPKVSKEIQKLENLRTELEKLPEDSKNTVAVAQTRAHLYEGRENSGLGKNRHGEQDINALQLKTKQQQDIGLVRSGSLCLERKEKAQ